MLSSLDGVRGLGSSLLEAVLPEGSTRKLFCFFFLEKYATAQFSQLDVPESWSLFFFFFSPVGLII